MSEITSYFLRWLLTIVTVIFILSLFTLNSEKTCFICEKIIIIILSLIVITDKWD